MTQKLKTLCQCTACTSVDLRASAEQDEAWAARRRDDLQKELDAVRRSSDKGSERGSVTDRFMGQQDAGNRSPPPEGQAASSVAPAAAPSADPEADPAAAPPESSDWQLVPEEGTGRTYWWNAATDEVSWSAPPGVAPPVEAAEEEEEVLEDLTEDGDEEGGSAPLWSMDGLESGQLGAAVEVDEKAVERV